jgi:hypothetical protein
LASRKHPSEPGPRCPRTYVPASEAPPAGALMTDLRHEGVPDVVRTRPRPSTASPAGIAVPGGTCPAVRTQVDATAATAYLTRTQ